MKQVFFKSAAVLLISFGTLIFFFSKGFTSALGYILYIAGLLMVDKNWKKYE